MYLARVFVTLKPTVNDPQGLAILGALHNLGFSTAVGVRAGKYIEIRLDEDDIVQAEERLQEMGHQLLANPVIEDFRFELDQV